MKWKLYGSDRADDCAQSTRRDGGFILFPTLVVMTCLGLMTTTLLLSIRWRLHVVMLETWSQQAYALADGEALVLEHAAAAGTLVDEVQDYGTVQGQFHVRVSNQGTLWNVTVEAVTAKAIDTLGFSYDEQKHQLTQWQDDNPPIV